ncbi:hypothetical protein [Streptomyces sp. NPDC059003]|uniref:hypothetical protein n=1 Tax=Streptomyces sp. NPDC059003 TaxID=3346691 RepID=UPI0036A232D3
MEDKIVDTWNLLLIIAAAVCTTVRLAALTCGFLRVLRGSQPTDRVELFACFTAAISGVRSLRRRSGSS